MRKYIERIIAKKEKGYAFLKSVRKIYADEYNIKIGYGSCEGCFNRANIPPGVVFGNYCSLANNVRILGLIIPLVILQPILYYTILKWDLQKKDSRNPSPLLIGHDVWIRANIVILPGVKNIGNGAMIGDRKYCNKRCITLLSNSGQPGKGN